MADESDRSLRDDLLLTETRKRRKGSKVSPAGSSKGNKRRMLRKDEIISYLRNISFDQVLGQIQRKLEMNN